MTTVQDLLALAASGPRMSGIAVDLHIGGGPPAVPGGQEAVESDAAERVWLARDGFAPLRKAADAAVCAALVRGIEALRKRDLPAAFIYAFDEPWTIGEHLRRRIAALLGRPYLLVEDIWAWHVPPGTGGWPPHRGIADVRLDREAPEMLNVWVALSDVPAERACMHAVPLDEDPGYPDSLQRLDSPLASVRALPVSVGHALFWNANVLHWGGRCVPRAEGPRVSCSFTLCRADAVARFTDLRLVPPLATFDHAARMDALARMILLYGDGQPDVTAVVREWATLTHELTARFRASPRT